MGPQSFIPEDLSSVDQEAKHQGIPRSDFRVVIKPKNVGLYQHREYDNGSSFVAQYEDSVIELLHRTLYSICIISYSDYDARAQIKIDGEVIGNFICLAKRITKIERPVAVDKGFVFVSRESSIAVRSTANIDSHSGFIQVIIRPQDPSFIQHTRPIWGSVETETDGGSRYLSTKSMKSGMDGQQIRWATACGPAMGEGVTASHDGLANSNSNFGVAAAATAPFPAAADAPFGLAATTTSTASSLGTTVLGEPTRQTYRQVPQIVTLGRHRYDIQLMVGDPCKNTPFYLDEDDRTHYRALRRQNL